MRQTKRASTDEQWDRLALHLPEHPRSPQGGRPRTDDRACLGGVLWLPRTGSRWRDIPLDLPPGSTCWRGLQEWAGAGVLEDLHAIPIEELDDLGALDFEELFSDATFIRAKKGALTWGKPGLARA